MSGEFSHAEKTIMERLLEGKPVELVYYSIDHYGTIIRFIEANMALLLVSKRGYETYLVAPPSYKESYFGFSKLNKKEAIGYLKDELGPPGSVLDSEDELVQKKYLDARGNICPCCGSRNICPKGKTVIPKKDNRAEQKKDCMDCGKKWVDVFTLERFYPQIPDKQ